MVVQKVEKPADETASVIDDAIRQRELDDLELQSEMRRSKEARHKLEMLQAEHEFARASLAHSKASKKSLASKRSNAASRLRAPSVH